MTTRDQTRWQDSAAVLIETLCTAAPDRVVATLYPSALLTDNRHAPLRAWLVRHHRLEWLVYLGSAAAQPLGVHQSFRMTLLVIRTGPAHEGEQRLLRLADLTELERPEWWKVLANAAKRGGGEAGPSIVLRNPQLDERPWTYLRFSKQFREIREDARQLGTLTPLKEFVESMQVGLERTVQAHWVVELDENGQSPKDAVPCYGGRSIQRGAWLGVPVCAIRSDGLSVDMWLRPGDVLVRSIVGLSAHSDAIVAARVPKHATPATFDRTCIRLRWRADVDDQVTDLLIGYLNSRHARDWLLADGVHTTLNVSTLERLEVPNPWTEVVEALGTLAQAEERYRQWADEAQTVRQELFAASSYGQQVITLLERQRIELERLRAAEDSQSLDYQIRNYYPHPLALRREIILQREHGKPRLDEILECAEYVMTFVAILSMIQVAEDHNVGSGIPTPQLRSYGQQGVLHLDWGKCLALIREGVAYTAQHDNPLALPFPALGGLEMVLADASSDRTQAESTLRKHRNRQAHLQHLPDLEVRDMSEEYTQLLDVLLGHVPFSGTIPLVYVLDYQLRPAGERVARFQLLQGASVAFQQREQPVPTELPRGVVGFLDQRGDFRSAFPWLILDTCPVCKRSELFVFNRIEGGRVTYVAMETGHPHHPTELADRLDALVRKATKES
jgi:hypothetical protein